jgi:RNA polymerase sigma-70 factor (ECF subfamily)
VTDEALMRAVRNGDVPRLGQLFERHHVGLFDFFSRTLGDRAAAEDLVQEVFVRILKYRRTYRDEGRFTTWMFHIARNVRTDHVRRRRPDQLTDDTPEPIAGGPGPAARVEAGEHIARLKRALMALPADKRELLVLARYRGLTHAEIGAVLRVDAGTVRVRVHRALNELRAMVERLSRGDQPWTAKRSGTGLPIA